MIKIHRTDIQTERMFDLEETQREHFFRNELMKPFWEMWEKINIPITSSKEGGYDVIMASKMLGIHTPNKITNEDRMAIRKIIESNLISECENALNCAVNDFKRNKIDIMLDELNFALFLGDSDNKSLMILNNGYCGFGGIPGYAFVYLWPNEYTMLRMKHAAVHEFNHNVRLQYQKWHSNINLQEYLVLEGLGESYAAELFGSELLGPWVTNFDIEELEYSKEVIKEYLDISGFSEIQSYMFGDEMADICNYPKVGLSHCAGYAVGYHIVQSFLKKTGLSVAKATTLSADVIINESKWL